MLTFSFISHIIYEGSINATLKYSMYYAVIVLIIYIFENCTFDCDTIAKKDVEH